MEELTKKINQNDLIYFLNVKLLEKDSMISKIVLTFLKNRI